MGIDGISQRKSNAQVATLGRTINKRRIRLDIAVMCYYTYVRQKERIVDMGTVTEDEEKERLNIENDELKRDFVKYKRLYELAARDRDDVVEWARFSKERFRVLNRSLRYLFLIASGLLLAALVGTALCLHFNEVWVGDVCLSCWGK